MAIEIWQGAKQAVEEQVAKELDPMGSVADMVKSGARGTIGQLDPDVGYEEPHSEHRWCDYRSADYLLNDRGAESNRVLHVHARRT